MSYILFFVGPVIFTLYIFSDTYLGLDQQYNIHLNMIPQQIRTDDMKWIEKLLIFPRQIKTNRIKWTEQWCKHTTTNHNWWEWNKLNSCVIIPCQNKLMKWNVLNSFMIIPWQITTDGLKWTEELFDHTWAIQNWWNEMNWTVVRSSCLKCLWY